MGTDVHGVWQARRKDGTWQDVPSNYTQDRHYQLFAVLADVRNGRGFAGIPTGEVVRPISPPRGLPSGFQRSADYEHTVPSFSCLDPRRQSYYKPDGQGVLDLWMGDHSFSWLSGAEMLAWYATAPTVVKTGVLGRPEYEAWDKESRPDSYCGGIAGMGVVVINDNAVERESTPGWTHIQCTWNSGLKEELAYFFDEVGRLQAEHGEVRFVFGFDS